MFTVLGMRENEISKRYLKTFTLKVSREWNPLACSIWVSCS